MRTGFLSLTSLILGLSLAWSAQASPIRYIDAWKKTFATSPKAIGSETITQLLGVPADCPSPSLIVGEVIRYRDLLYSSHSETRPNEVGEQLMTEIAKIAAEAPSVCRDATLSAYAAASVALLTRFWDAPKTLAGVQAQLPIEASWVFATIAATRAHILEFSDSLPAHVTGTYNCVRTKILVDPKQRPLNLAATVVHEFSHYFLDKNSVANLPTAPQSHIKPEMLNWFIVLDEALASLNAGYMQRLFAERALHYAPTGNGDLSFYAQSGPLTHIESKIPAAAYSALGTLDTFSQFELTAQLTFFHMQLQNVELSSDGKVTISPYGFGSKDLDRYRVDLFDRIAKVYYGRSLNEKEVHALNPSVLTAAFPETKRVTRFMPFFFTPFELFGETGNPLVLGDDILDLNEKIVAHNIDLLPAAKMALLGFTSAFKRKSDLCASFESAVNDGLLRDYLGTRLPDVIERVTRPGSEGVRPGSSAVRACVQIGDKI
jgi:hypothetical protein